jgi:Diguanylate cyclase, GGDEF domain
VIAPSWRSQRLGHPLLREQQPQQLGPGDHQQHRALDRLGRGRTGPPSSRASSPNTALPNRALLMERLQAELARAARRREPVFLLWLDLDDFKVVNDSLGHPRATSCCCGRGAAAGLPAAGRHPGPHGRE